jgi:RNA polymerase sigma-70 factor (ECF subfamily)
MEGDPGGSIRGRAAAGTRERATRRRVRRRTLVNADGAPVEPVGVEATRASTDLAISAAWADHHAELFAFLVRATRQPDVAEDLLQDAFIRLTREVRNGRTPDNIRAWLYRVGANLVVSRGRRLSTAVRGLVKLRGPADAYHASDAPEAGFLQREGHAVLMGLLDDVGPDARTALLLSSEGFNGAEIAASIGRSELATRALLTRTRIKLRQGLEAADAGR